MDLSRLDRLIDVFLENKDICDSVLVSDFRWICEQSVALFSDEPTLLDIVPPVFICGDIHGQYTDLLKIFQVAGFVPENKFLFLGDYVDRGDQSVEVIGLLLLLKIRYPNHVYLLRGNHESPEMTEQFGFAAELHKKLDDSIFNDFMNVFDHLPIAAIIGNQIFAVHGGLSPSIESLDEIREIKRPTKIPEDGVLADLLWSDPSPKESFWGPNDRGSTITWGQDAAEQFLSNNKLKIIVRGHQLAHNGYQYPFYPNRSVVTVFSASNYARKFRNQAAFMIIKPDCTCDFCILPQQLPFSPIQRTVDSFQQAKVFEKDDLDPPVVCTPRVENKKQY